MIKLKTGIVDFWKRPPNKYDLQSLENEMGISLLEAAELFEQRCGGYHGDVSYRVAAFGWDGVELGPSVEQLYQAFRSRLLYELMDHLPGLVEVEEGDIEDEES